MIKAPAPLSLAFALALCPVLSRAQQAALPSPVAALRQAGPLDIQLRTDTGRDVNLRLEQQYTTQPLGNNLTTEQIEKLDTIRSEAPDKYQILSCLFPRQIAEFLLRTPAPDAPAPADDALERIVWEIASDYISRPQDPSFTENQRRARAAFIKASLQELPPEPEPIRHLLEQASRYEDADFSSPDKADTFLALKDGYSPFRRVAMSIVGDTLCIDGTVITEHLAADAAAARQPPEQYAQDYCDRVSRALDQWRAGQITGNAYAGTIRRFLNDPRLAEFTPEEVSRAYKRVYGRDLKTDLYADRVASLRGRPVTYNELRGGKL